MPSFDIVSKVIVHELVNAIDQANREVKTRFDFKDSNANFAYSEDKITLIALNKFQLQQMAQILDTKLTKRGIDITCLERAEATESLHEARQVITIRQGIDHETGKIVTSPDIISRGFIYMREREDLVYKARQEVKKMFAAHNEKYPANWDFIKKAIRQEMGDFLFAETERKPMVIPVIIEV